MSSLRPRFVSIATYVIVVCFTISCFHWLNKLCGTIIKFADVSDNGYKSWEKKYFDEFQLKSSLILNAPFQNISTIHVSNDDSIKILHHGLALESRHIENMIFMCDFLDSRFTLDLMLVPNKLDYYESLIKLCESRKNVRIIEPVNFEQIIPFSTLKLMTTLIRNKVNWIVLRN